MSGERTAGPAAGREEGAAPRALVVHGPGADPSRHGLRCEAPGTFERLDAWCAAWAAEMGWRADAVAADDERALAAAVGGAEADGVVLVPGELTASARVAQAVAASPAVAVEVHLGGLRRRGHAPGATPVGAACARTLHGRGTDGYRDALRHLAHRHGWPPAELAYGSHPEQVADLRVPAGGGPHPVVLLLHGGFWLDAWARDVIEAPAVDLARRGVATANVEYRRLGSGGGWPATGRDVAAAAAWLDGLAGPRGLDPGRLALVGHSAGGQLALWLAAAGEAPRPRVVAALAPVADLADAVARGLGGSAVGRFVADAPQATEAASPVELVPIGVPLLVAHADDDALVPPAQSHRFAEAARAAGDDVDAIWLPRGGHFAFTDPGAPAWDTVAARLLARL